MKRSNFTSRILFASLILLVSLTGVYLGIRFLISYSSSSFVLYESIQNIYKERENTIKSKSIFLANLSRIQSLSKHIVSSQEEIPYVVSQIEEYADSLKADITINSINLEDVKDTGENNQSGRKLILDTNVVSSFDNLIKMLKMIENSDYIISIDEYNLREVAILEPNRPGGSVTYRDISFTDDSLSINKKTWMLGLKLSLKTNIK